MRHRLSLSASLALLSAWLGLPAAALAQIDPPPTQTLTIVASHDYDAVAPTYCVLGKRIDGVGTVSTVGASTTFTASTTTAYSRAPGVAVGAWFDVDRGQTSTFVNAYVHTVTDGDTLVVNDAATISPSSWGYRNLACGTGVDAGWFDVSKWASATFVFHLTNLEFDAGDAVVSLQCRDASPWAAPVTLYPLAAALGSCPADGGFDDSEDGSCAFTIDTLAWSTCRVGVAVADDEADDLTTNRERISIAVVGR